MLASTKTFAQWVLALAILAMPAVVFAGPASRTTTFTFNQPVALPGVTLPAGTYQFRLAEPVAGRRIVHVLSADGLTPYAMFFATEGQLVEPSHRPSVRFMKTGVGMPAAIDTWLYPGERRGLKFVYPAEQARMLAQGRSEGDLAARTIALPPSAMPGDVGVRQ
jgi:hypothetical protein